MIDEKPFCPTDKGENIWDFMTHTQPDKVRNKDNGDIACDSYHKYKEDVQLIKDIGVRIHSGIIKGVFLEQSIIQV